MSVASLEDGLGLRFRLFSVAHPWDDFSDGVIAYLMNVFLDSETLLHPVTNSSLMWPLLFSCWIVVDESRGLLSQIAQDLFILFALLEQGVCVSVV